MNAIDIVLMIVIAGLVVTALIKGKKYRRENNCSGNCGNCSGNCGKNNFDCSGMNISENVDRR